jgi:hypothetical protein
MVAHDGMLTCMHYRMWCRRLLGAAVSSWCSQSRQGQEGRQPVGRHCSWWLKSLLRWEQDGVNTCMIYTVCCCLCIMRDMVLVIPCYLLQSE